MPSALESLVKILKLEQQKACQDTAVIGGLKAFSETWKDQAVQQAKRPEHYILIDELVDLLHEYESIPTFDERYKSISYMLDRIMGREPAPEKYAARLASLTIEEKKPAPPPPAPKPRPEPVSPSPQQHQHHHASSSVGSDAALKKDWDDPEVNSHYKAPTPVTTASRLLRPPRERREISLDEALRNDKDLDQVISHIKGIGPKLAESFHALDLYTIRDALNYLPRRYDDYTRMLKISELKPFETVTVIGTVVFTQTRVSKNNRQDFFMTVEDGTGRLAVTFFNQYWLMSKIRKGSQISLRGKVTIFRDMLQMSNPEWEALDLDNLKENQIVPVYRLTESLKPRSFRRWMKQIVTDWADKLVDPLPLAMLERAELADLNWAVKQLHFPLSMEHLGHARRRYIFDQLLTLQLAILGNRREWQAQAAIPLMIEAADLQTFKEAVFDFELTSAQNRVVSEILGDFEKSIPMNRLIQGDVGSGKTAVALIALVVAFMNQKQAAMMAPTSILAEQHYRNLEKMLLNYPFEDKPRIALLTGSLNNAERQAIYEGLASGEIDIVVGTHALIQEGLVFKQLAVAVIDEQHRFGVEQRGALRGKGTNPHLLVMTATPIPRTLALTIHADLDLSVIDEKPPGRKAIRTKIYSPADREVLCDAIRREIYAGRQAFIVHPLVEASEGIDARSAIEAYEEFQQVFYQQRVCLLHGRMASTEKDEIMAAFANHKYDVMVTTSVAEVGVDVPNASVVMIEGANRFGLAQLHQFRGRVGRGEHQSYCFLIPDQMTVESTQRLQAMEKTEDGFELADLDWKMRGAGDLIGQKQSGRSIIQLMDEVLPDLVELSRQEALTLYAEDPDLVMEQHSILARRVDEIRQDQSDMS